MKVKTSELIGRPLDYAVAKCEGVNEEAFHLYYEPTEPADYDSHGYPEFHYSTVWAQGGPIIEREKISPAYEPSLMYDDSCRWKAVCAISDAEKQYGPTPLVAAMRSYVSSKLGDKVEVPDELMGS